LIIGVGNTAMDCRRSWRRPGGRDIKVSARRPREVSSKHPWELEDAEEEGVEIVVNHAPKRFVFEHGKLVGMEFERAEWDTDGRQSRTIDSVILPCDDAIHPGIGQEAAFPDRA
jgi:NADPH-dependent glutamate synthase beta subunit-like oxidoreductase